MNQSEREELQDLLMSEKWRVVKSIYDELNNAAMKGLVAVADGGSFHRLQGVIEGMTLLIETIENRAKPEAIEWSSDTQEYVLNARKQ